MDMSVDILCCCGCCALGSTPTCVDVIEGNKFMQNCEGAAVLYHIEEKLIEKKSCL